MFLFRHFACSLSLSCLAHSLVCQEKLYTFTQTHTHTSKLALFSERRGGPLRDCICSAEFNRSGACFSAGLFPHRHIDLPVVMGTIADRLLRDTGGLVWRLKGLTPLTPSFVCMCVWVILSMIVNVMQYKPKWLVQQVWISTCCCLRGTPSTSVLQGFTIFISQLCLVLIFFVKDYLLFHT